MNFTKHIFLFLIGCAGIMPALAQQTYTLDECIREALSNNVRIKNANNDLSASQHVRQKAFTKYFPTFSASGGGFMSDKGLLEMEMMPGEKISMLKNIA